MRALLTTLILLALSQPALAHDFWIEPDTFTPTKNEQVAIELREGVDFRGDTLPYIEDWFKDFSMVTGAGRAGIESLTGNDPAATVVTPPGQTLLGYQSVRAFTELEAAKFNSYLEEEGIEFLREQRISRGEDNEPAPEYFVRCAKALLQNSKPGAETWDKVLGYTLEIVPTANPYERKPGEQLEFTLLFRGKPIEGLQFQAFTREDPAQVQKVRTDENGRVTIDLNRSGTWMIKAVQIQGIVGDPKALWQSWWATYLFDVD